MCLGIVLQGVGYCKSKRTVLFKRCTFAMLLFRHCFKRTDAYSKVNSDPNVSEDMAYWNLIGFQLSYQHYKMRILS